MTDTTEAQEQETEKEEAQPPEEAARKMGWKPKEEWDGEDDRWMPADEFIGRNERLKARADGIAKAEIANLRDQLSRMTQVVEDLKGHMSRAEQGAYKRALADIKAKQKQAVADGDTQAFEDAEREADQLQKEAEEAKPKPKETPANPDSDPDFVAWLEDNRWYDPSDPDALDLEMRAFANTIGQEAAGIGIKGKKLYELVGTEVRKKFPEKFGNPKRKNAAAVESSGQGGERRGGKKGYADLPADAKAICDRLVGQKVYDRPSQGKTLTDKEARERYASEFFGEE